MAKYEDRFKGDFNELLRRINDGILSGSVSASFEDGSDYQSGSVRCAVRVYERYSMMGSGRLSMAITLVCNEDDLFITAITAGGSQAVFFKINTLGETSFLQRVVDIIEEYKRAR